MATGMCLSEGGLVPTRSPRSLASPFLSGPALSHLQVPRGHRAWSCASREGPAWSFPLNPGDCGSPRIPGGPTGEMMVWPGSMEEARVPSCQVPGLQTSLSLGQGWQGKAGPRPRTDPILSLPSQCPFSCLQWEPSSGAGVSGLGAPSCRHMSPFGLPPEALACRCHLDIVPGTVSRCGAPGAPSSSPRASLGHVGLTIIRTRTATPARGSGSFKEGFGLLQTKGCVQMSIIPVPGGTWEADVTGTGATGQSHGGQGGL